MIYRLPAEVYLKIAAGEVIERPLSVVKELVENSIDAAAKKVEVELLGGGKKLIKVKDDGSGFPIGEIELAFERHCTSKIKSLQDLDSVSTLGFRGEALSSVIEVADLRVCSSDNERGEGISVLFENRSAIERKTVSMPRGTVIEVYNLFKQFPVRLKFLKSDQYETRLITEFLASFFLFHFSKAVSLKTEKKIILDYQQAGNICERIYQVFGQEVFRQLVPVEFSKDGWQVSGMVSAVNKGFLRKDLQYFAVNGRLVKDRLLFGITKNILQQYIEKSQNAAVIISIIAPAGEVDANIHPQKLEIRFRDTQKLFSVLRQALLSALGISEYRSSYACSGSSNVAQKNLWLEKDAEINSRTNPESNSQPLLIGLQEEFAEHSFRVLGQYQNSYIVAEKDGNLLIVDQHNAHERILFERFKKRKKESAITSVRTLLPIVIQLSAAEITHLEGKRTEIEELGFELELFSAGTLSIKSYPDFLTIDTVREIFLELLQTDFTDQEQLWHSFLSTAACRQAVKANTVLSLSEQEEILKNLFVLDNYQLCPHRRPIVVETTLQEIEKKLKRR